ncbi:hypothetical protein NZK81_19340 [Novosphingobium sp. HK4-1]|uniref:Uncharacterized protein n=1 Tax=Novosphingobium mangrovi (ex Huang et al. 2023) TaxID=2976432 RepID=A0ABT2IA85_9SPHN|nr:hypothetical protein [Novosphingobium mangrovi (ex Huang et al. 2023)]
MVGPTTSAKLSCKARYRALTDLQGIHGGHISRADVADFMLAQAKAPTFTGQTPC